MAILNENIRLLRKKQGWTQQDLADRMGIKRSLVGAYEEGRAEPSTEKLIRFSSILNVSVDSLIGRNLLKEDPDKPSFKVLSITVDNEDKENIEFVQQKAAAGYTSGHADTEFIQSLPRFQLPFLPSNGTYRAFEISGDSMHPIQSGSIIIGQYIENANEIKNGKTYILVTRNEGVVFKRVFNYLKEKNKLFLVSDNKLYSPFELEPEEVMEVWKATAYISINFPDPADSGSDSNLSELLSVVTNLQDDVKRLKEKQK